jgi:hypothetical protein
MRADVARACERGLALKGRFQGEGISAKGDRGKATLVADLRDAQTITVPLAWHPRLMHATCEEGQNWRLIGRGQGIHWEDVDEDISIESILLGQPSAESQFSLNKWLENQKRRITKEPKGRR